MADLKITKGTHFFKVTRISPRARAAVESFARRLVQYGFVRMGSRYTRAALKVFAMATENREEYRFHINQYREFEQHLEANYLRGDMVEIDTLPLHTPKQVEFKIQPHWEDRDYQVPVIEYLKSNELPRAKFVDLQTGKGKATKLSAKIKIPGGWSTMGEMYVGKEITAKDGSVTKVTHVHPQGKLQMYKVTFGDGRSIECCAEHLWRVYYVNTEPHMRWRVINTLEVLRLISMPNPRVYVDLIDPEDCNDLDLPIDPYVLGLILGDGCISQKSIQITKDDEFIFDEIRKTLPESLRLSIHTTPNKCLGYNIVRKDNTVTNNVYVDALKDLDLMGKLSYEKFIPKEYLNSSYNQRLAILQGLLDTDGYCGKDSSIEYSTASEQLALDVQYLVRSIGGVALIRSRDTHYVLDNKKIACRTNYRMTVRIKNPSTLFRLPRKKERTNDFNQYSVSLKLKVLSIEPTTIEEAQCISIDHPDRLYVTDDFIVTHNSYCTMRAMQEDGVLTIITVKPMYIDKWVEDIHRTYEIAIEDIMVIRGSSQLMAMLLMAEEGELNVKIIIISNKTIQNWIKLYEKFMYETLNMGYACVPEDLAKYLKAGIVLIDEVHQDFHFNFKYTLTTNVPKSISLSATMIADDDFINKMYEIAYPAALRYKGPAYDKYVAAIAVIYKLKFPNKMRCKDNVSKNYSHHLFEQSILRSNELSSNYLDLIKKIVDGSYLKDYKQGQRCLIFAISIEMCTVIMDYLTKCYPHLVVKRYVEEDPYENLMTSDICVSTMQSSGTAVDIPELTTVIMTTAMSSSQGNVQGFGRLRKLKDGTVPQFLYFCCENVDSHVKYHEKKRVILESRALTYKSVSMSGYI